MDRLARKRLEKLYGSPQGDPKFFAFKCSRCHSMVTWSQIKRDGACKHCSHDHMYFPRFTLMDQIKLYYIPFLSYWLYR